MSKRGRQRCAIKSAKAGLMFPVGRVGRYLKKGRFAKRVRSSAPVFLAAVLEFLVSQVLELAGNAAKHSEKRRIISRHIQLAIRNHSEIAELLAGVTSAYGGVLPNFHGALLATQSAAGTKELEETEGS